MNFAFDRVGNPLIKGDTVMVAASAFGLEHPGSWHERIVDDFEEGPDYDPSCMGVIVRGQSVHPHLVLRKDLFQEGLKGIGQTYSFFAPLNGQVGSIGRIDPPNPSYTTLHFTGRVLIGGKILTIGYGRGPTTTAAMQNFFKGIRAALTAGEDLDTADYYVQFE
jgi:hypothetical protein